MTTTLRGINCPERILIPRNSEIILNEILAVANSRQKETDVADIQKSILSIQHKLNIAMYQAALTCALNTDHYSLFELYPDPTTRDLKSSDMSYKICSYSMRNIEEYLLVLTSFIEVFAASVFSLFDVSGSLINQLYKLNLREDAVTFYKTVSELQKQNRVDPNDDVFRLLSSYYLSEREPTYASTVPLRDIAWIRLMKEIRNRTTHMPITEVCDFIKRGDVYSPFYSGIPETEFFLNRKLSTNTKLCEFVKEVFDGIELFVEELYFYLSQAINRSGSLPIY